MRRCPVFITQIFAPFMKVSSSIIQLKVRHALNLTMALAYGCIDLILTNQKYSLKNICAIETGVSDFLYRMVYTQLSEVDISETAREIC